MDIFAQYGIKEVADVCIYSIHKKKDGSGELYYVPALYLDTLKVSTTEKTAENVWAQGGLGNSRLICWDYGKQINITLEDALCTPASLGLCWGGVLGADWKDGKLKQDLGISWNSNKVEKLSRMEKAFYTRDKRKNSTISYLLPQTAAERQKTAEEELITSSSVVDGIKADGYGMVKNKSYKWTLYVESDIKSIAQVPDKFFDINGKSYDIDDTAQVVVDSKPGGNYKFQIRYKLKTDKQEDLSFKNEHLIKDVHNKDREGTNAKDETKSSENTEYDIVRVPDSFDFDSDNVEEWKNYLAICIDNNNNYTAFTTATEIKGNEGVYCPVNVEQFKGLDLWVKFDSINEMIYYIMTKYEDNIYEIVPRTYNQADNIMKATDSREDSSTIGKIWAYVNPKTMQPYADDYWFHKGEPYYKKSLTFSDPQELKAQRIIVPAGQFPGMYMIVGETYIRSRDTGEDERLQLKFPLCKIKSNQTLTLQAEGDPTTFNLEVEVARPENGVMMEITSYEVEKKVQENEYGTVEEFDGSTEISRG